MAHIISKLALPLFILLSTVLTTIALAPAVQSWSLTPTLVFCFAVTAVGGVAVSWLFVVTMLLVEDAQDAREAASLA